MRASLTSPVLLLLLSLYSLALLAVGASEDSSSGSHRVSNSASPSLSSLEQEPYSFNTVYPLVALSRIHSNRVHDRAYLRWTRDAPDDKSETASAPDVHPHGSDASQAPSVPPDSRLTVTALARHNQLTDQLQSLIRARDAHPRSVGTPHTSRVSSAGLTSMVRDKDVHRLSLQPIWDLPEGPAMVRYRYYFERGGGPRGLVQPEDTMRMQPWHDQGRRSYQAAKKRRPGYVPGYQKRRAEAQRGIKAVARGHLLSDPCAICLEPTRGLDRSVPQCGHALHEQCLAQLRGSDGEHARRCPTCQAELKGWERRPQPESGLSGRHGGGAWRPPLLRRSSGSDTTSRAV